MLRVNKSADSALEDSVIFLMITPSKVLLLRLPFMGVSKNGRQSRKMGGNCQKKINYFCQILNSTIP